MTMRFICRLDGTASGYAEAGCRLQAVGYRLQERPRPLRQTVACSL
jgi:hypothetical protein